MFFRCSADFFFLFGLSIYSPKVLMMNILFIIGKLQFKKISRVDQSQAFKSTLGLLPILNSHIWVLPFNLDGQHLSNLSSITDQNLSLASGNLDSLMCFLINFLIPMLLLFFKPWMSILLSFKVQFKTLSYFETSLNPAAFNVLLNLHPQLKIKLHHLVSCKISPNSIKSSQKAKNRSSINLTQTT